MTMKVSHYTCNMCICNLPDMYSQSPRLQARGMRAYISGKTFMLIIITTTYYWLMHYSQGVEHLLYSGNTLYIKPDE